ncbi:hypothetical protein [Methanopyrus sp.]
MTPQRGLTVPQAGVKPTTPRAGIHRDVLVIEVFPGAVPDTEILRDLNERERRLLLAAAGYDVTEFWARSFIGLIFDHPTPLVGASERHEKLLPEATVAAARKLCDRVKPEKLQEIRRRVASGETPREAVRRVLGSKIAGAVSRLLGRVMGYVQSDPLSVAITLQALGTMIAAGKRLEDVSKVLIVVPYLEHVRIDSHRLARRVYSNLLRAMTSLRRHFNPRVKVRVYVAKEDKLEHPAGDSLEEELVEAYEELSRKPTVRRFFPERGHFTEIPWDRALAEFFVRTVRRELHRRSLKAARTAKRRGVPGRELSDVYNREYGKWLSRWFRRGRRWLSFHRPSPALSDISCCFVTSEAGVEGYHENFLIKVINKVVEEVVERKVKGRRLVRMIVKKVARSLKKSFKIGGKMREYILHMARLLSGRRKATLDGKTILEAFGVPPPS